ncbi:acylamino-acid-releasing enzyme-like [Hyposmocoma kahamanoa]|uniref:acylamino-acid-releasing enzyme-like n=1 Tax=Hyposmocoma kahamanoa TaxID=1477025 RepID=UPI000E6D990D|nr:acylamino-acid-releasing enzyme-like [Hyposmocoma kahamanoa]
MLKMSSQIETIVNAYKTLSKIPTIVGGKLNKSATGVTAKWSVRNLDKGKTTKYLYDYVLDEKLNVISESEYPTDISNELLSAVSPGGRYKAIIREEKDTKEVKKQYLEVWSRATLAHCVDLTALDLHGDVYADSEFGSLDWSPDESSIVYVAERKLKKSEPYIKRKGEEKPKADGSGEAPPKKGEEYIYRQDWGEQLVGKHFSVVVVCRVETETFTVLDSDVLPDTCCPGQVRFSPNGACVCGVAWHTEPRRLGLIFCTNRPSFIFEVALDGTHKRVVSGEGVAVRSPRYGVDGQLLWLQRAAGGPHHAAHALLRARKDSIETSTVVDVVDTERIIENKDKFYGIYCAALPTRCFANDGRLVFSSSQRNDVRSYVLHLDSGKLVDVSIRNTPGSTTVLDVRNDVILASFSNMTTPSTAHTCSEQWGWRTCRVLPHKRARCRHARTYAPLAVRHYRHHHFDPCGARGGTDRSDVTLASRRRRSIAVRHLDHAVGPHLRVSQAM